MHKDHSREFPAGALIALLICCLVFVTTVFLRSCPSILALDLQATFMADSSNIAFFSSATLLGYGLMQVPSGLITDIIGGKKTLAIFMGLAALATLAFAFAPNLPTGVAARFVTGITLAAVPPAGAILAIYFPPSHYAKAMGIFIGSSAMGTVMASEPLARLSNSIGWRYSMVIVAIWTAMLCIMAYTMIRDTPTPKIMKKNDNRFSWSNIGKNMLTVLSTPQFWPLALWQLCASGISFAFFSMWAGPFLMESYSMSKVEAARIILGQGIIGIFFIPFMTSMSDRIGSRKIMLIICSILGALGCLAMFMFPAGLHKYVMMLCMLCISATAGVGCTCIFAVIQKNFPIRLTGTGIGCVNMLWPIFAAALGIIFGKVLKWKIIQLERTQDMLLLATASLESIKTDITVHSYSFSILIFVGFWVFSLLLAIFLIRDDFKVNIK